LPLPRNGGQDQAYPQHGESAKIETILSTRWLVERFFDATQPTDALRLSGGLRHSSIFSIDRSNLNMSAFLTYQHFSENSASTAHRREQEKLSALPSLKDAEHSALRLYACGFASSFA